MADNRLRRELALVLVVKLAAIGLLWWAFVRDAEVVPSAQDVAVATIETPELQGHQQHDQ